MIRRPPRTTLLTHSFPTRRSSDLGTQRQPSAYQARNRRLARGTIDRPPPSSRRRRGSSCDVHRKAGPPPSGGGGYPYPATFGTPVGIALSHSARALRIIAFKASACRCQAAFGRASLRETVCRNVYILVVAVILKTNIRHHQAAPHLRIVYN